MQTFRMSQGVWFFPQPDYRSWDEGEPTYPGNHERCAVINGKDYRKFRWRTDYCNIKAKFICEIPAVEFDLNPGMIGKSPGMIIFFLKNIFL